MKRHAMTPLSLLLTTLLAACTSQEVNGVQTLTFAAGDHRQGRLVYAQTPPAGGPHNPSWQNCGVYPTPLSNEYVVHSLEHGAVWITYQPSASAEAVQQLTQLAKSRSHVLVSPYPEQSALVVLTAWGKQLSLTQADDPRIKAFLARYEQGPGTPERGAPCSGGYSGTA